MWQRYLHLVKTRPLLTNALTAGLIGGVGDVAAQQLENHFVKKRGFLSASELNFKRLGQITAWGFLWLGVPMYWWFRVLDKWFPPGVGGVKQLTKKICFNQTTMAPFSNAAFFGFVQANQHGIEDLPARLATKLKGDFLYVTLNSCLFWVPAHVVNFLYVSPHLRVFFLSCGMVLWTTYLDLVGHRQPKATSVEFEDTTCDSRGVQDGIEEVEI